MKRKKNGATPPDSSELAVELFGRIEKEEEEEEGFEVEVEEEGSTDKD